jgi:enoyl-CoA hydratase/carnithine racemase
MLVVAEKVTPAAAIRIGLLDEVSDNPVNAALEFIANRNR